MSFGFKTRILKVIEDVLSYRGRDFKLEMSYSQEYDLLTLATSSDLESEIFGIYLAPPVGLNLSVEDLDNRITAVENFLSSINKE